MKLFGISEAAREVPCPEGYLRELDKRGIIKPQRVAGNKRVLTQADIEAARKYRNRAAK